ncbi:hypothetical protein WA026_016776 [Henosepilachna vigintioctopunctata]|uniref:Peptidase S1 domain-containing protein n=1 Tax=Henosepilachna vigintioctopunctata TaxID=420089 RepID=A0AAW1UVH5_9CUCU
MFLSVILASLVVITSCASNAQEYEGEEASIGNYSYMGVLTITKRFIIPIKWWQHRCVSVIVSPEYAVTSARCAKKKYISGTSRKFTYDCSDLREPDCNHLKLRNQAIIHPDYTNQADNDIAVFRIEKPIKNENLKPVKLPESSGSEPEGNGTLVFWASSENEYLFSVLRELPVSVTKCSEELASETSFCVGDLVSPEDIERGSAFVIGETLYGIVRDFHGNQVALTNVGPMASFIKRVADLD